jgi:hypothetical protein
MRGKGEGSVFRDSRGLWTAKVELPSHDGIRRTKVDTEGQRYAGFPNVEKATDVAGKLNQPTLEGMPNLANVLTWRSTITGRLLEGKADHE